MIKMYKDENNNEILQIFSGDTLISKKVTKLIPDSVVSLNEQKPEIIEVENSKFYLLNYEDDFIQSCIWHNHRYFSDTELNVMKNYLNEDSVVVDIGANIGNHTLYFANECNVKKIYAYEPVPYTFKLLQKNIQINHIEDKVTAQCIGFADTITQGAIKTYDLKNLGGTRLKPYKNGDIKLVTLDSLNISDKIDFIKIDVEAMDYQVLCGAEQTIKKHKPIIEIESFDDDRKNSDPFLKKLGYKVAQEFRNVCEYIYVPSDDFAIG